VRVRSAALMLPAVLLVAAACAADPQDPGLMPEDPSGRDDALHGNTFVGVGRTVDGEPDPLVKGTTPQIGFTDEGVSAYAGCNHLSGQARYADGKLTVDVVGGTEMGCDQARMDQDAWLADFLSGDPRYRLDGDVLTLSAGGTTLSLRRQADTDTALTGTTWVFEGIVDGTGPDASVGSVPDGVVSTLRLRDDGVALIRTGCNTGSASVTIEADSMHLSDLMTTKIACEGAHGAVEREVLRVVHNGEITLAQDGDSLDLSDGEHGLYYRAR